MTTLGVLDSDRPAFAPHSTLYSSQNWLRWAEPAAFIALVVTALATFILIRETTGQAVLAPWSVALLLVLNLLPAMALLVFVGRRIVLRRAGTAAAAGARLHTRLVALFSVTAMIPTVLVVIFSTYLFQSGMEFWFSDRSRGMFENAVSVAQNFFESEQRHVSANTRAMARDLRAELRRTRVDSDAFYDFYVQQVVVRELSESAIIQAGPDGISRTLALIDPQNSATENRLPATTIGQLRSLDDLVADASAEGTQATVRLLPDQPIFLVASRGSSLLGQETIGTARSVLADYNALFQRSRALQFRFVAALYIGALMLVGLAVWAAIIVADRLTSPIDELVGAAQRVAAGDLEVRVRHPGGREDEIATLAKAFNAMTEKLGEQTRDLLSANDQIESRRAFTEAVLGGVASGVVSIDAKGKVSLANAAAHSMLGAQDGTLVGESLFTHHPTLGEWLKDDHADPVVELEVGGETRTLAVKAFKGSTGFVLTFEDITQQLADQRRAAWSDVARRIAHEIKNPLTPIQLAAERLQRRFGKEMGEGEETFRRLTSTIIRQVGDLRRMVDEFSSFARMPKPTYREENVIDIVRQTVFLHDVAHTDIAFSTAFSDGPINLICDRRLLSQAMTNILKNAVEAIAVASKGGGAVHVTVDNADGQISIAVEDDGVGLPDDRSAIVEPYVTMRDGGTGLGLAIVRKIVEEHGGQLRFSDRLGGGSVVSMIFVSAVAMPTAPLAAGTAHLVEEG